MSKLTKDKFDSNLFKIAALQSLNTSGQFTIDEREAIASAIAAGVNSFRQRMLDNFKRSSEITLLRVIAQMQEQLPPGHIVHDIRIAERMRNNIQSIREDLAHIEEEGYITLERSADRWLVQITPQGQEILKENNES
jgi:DNA-binding MarR family transcriptional regulator